MAPIVASLVGMLAFVSAAMAQTGTYGFTNPSYYPNQCKTGQVSVFWAGGPAANTATLFSNVIAGGTNASALTFFAITRYLKDVTSNVPLTQVSNAGALIGLQWPTTVSILNATDAQIIQQLSDDCNAVFQYTQKAPKYIYLPIDTPQSAYNTVKSQGYIPVGYNLDSGDYMYASSNNAAACQTGILQNYITAFTQLPNGTSTYVAVNSDLWPCSAQTAPFIFATIRSYNYTAVNIATCLGDTSPYRTCEFCSGTGSAPAASSASSSGTKAATATAGPTAASPAAAPPAAATSGAAKPGAAPRSSSISVGGSLSALAGVALAALAL
ncbi:hypothetical protein M427DRAFT_61185 [Gonapodya prolifera JEL478]|uniref:Carbohydrate esterase family 4 protein n=1 Tax=Gonapodya prolifera (strain JEL478) TaxID=1344416 RepID=A0A139A352_GONPJ|nr:hypothetical protein M427DRAFT_61185 [Gonapodya prolifera JEL478]|eukprot:KXS11099.1 hypothetical protein M427DRAFT_61185 [Gonapodya prolifera JEL478]